MYFLWEKTAFPVQEGFQKGYNIFPSMGEVPRTFHRALAKKRSIFGKRILEFQAKAFEMADFYARMEAARLRRIGASRAQIPHGCLGLLLGRGHPGRAEAGTFQGAPEKPSGMMGPRQHFRAGNRHSRHTQGLFNYNESRSFLI